MSAQRKTIREATAAMEKAFVSQIIVDVTNGDAPLADVPQAPPEYWTLFEKAERLADRKPFYVPPPYPVRASAADMRIAA